MEEKYKVQKLFMDCIERKRIEIMGECGYDYDNNQTDISNCVHFLKYIDKENKWSELKSKIPYVVKSTSEKFEDLSQDEIIFFAKIGFNFYQSYKQCFERAMDPTYINSVTQPISDEQKRFMQELNANNQRIIESLNSSVKL